MTELNDQNLTRALQSGGLMSVYLVAGNDAFLVDACARQIIKAAADSPDGVVLLDAEKSPDDELEGVFLNCSLISERKAVVFGGFEPAALSAARYELLSSLFSSVPDDITVIIKCYSEEKQRYSVPKKARDLAAAAPKSAVVLAAQKTGSDILAYIYKLAEKEGCSMGASAAKRVAELCADDLMLASGEIKKLASLCGYGEITLADVDALCVRTPEAGVYDMISAIERDDRKKALAVLRDMLDMRTPPLAICAALYTAFVNLYRAKLVKNAKKGESAMFELFDYKKGDRKVSIALERCGRYKLESLESIIDILYELDCKLKSSTVDQNTILETQIVKLMLAVQSR